MTRTEHEAAIKEIDANIEICSPNEFGKYPFGKDVLTVWLSLKQEHENAIIAMAEKYTPNPYRQAKCQFIAN